MEIDGLVIESRRNGR